MAIKYSLLERILAWFFPIKDMGIVELDRVQFLRRAQSSSDRFWGGKAPMVLYWETVPERFLSDNLKRKLEMGEELPPPKCIVG